MRTTLDQQQQCSKATRFIPFVNHRFNTTMNAAASFTDVNHRFIRVVILAKCHSLFLRMHACMHAGMDSSHTTTNLACTCFCSTTVSTLLQDCSIIHKHHARFIVIESRSNPLHSTYLQFLQIALSSFVVDLL